MKSERNISKGFLLVTSLAFMAGFLFLNPSAAPAAEDKVPICHFPPGNPANFHTITVSARALDAHATHGDFGGPCDEHCEEICSDGDACTIDACDPKGGCADPAPVDCNDDDLCTTDSCEHCPEQPVCQPPAPPASCEGVCGGGIPANVRVM